VTIIHFPPCADIAYNLNQLPEKKEDRAIALKSLAEAVLDYSKQLEQFFKDNPENPEPQ
jgi:hypothetical protein